uniref:Knottin scorpion toxin-like domain-containing protein n=1 Tax=Leersia perrieri TaxID=77586 RepID=A0A0D9VF70_9ORYZ
MRASQIMLLTLALVLAVLSSSNELAKASAEARITPEANCSPVALMIGDPCTPKVCRSNCLKLGAVRGNCIGGPACNCDFCGPTQSPASAPQ